MTEGIDKQRTLEALNRMSADTLMRTLDIRYSDVGSRWLKATMKVDERHHQPMGILHGGATAALAESVGSAASGLELRGSGRHAVGLELSINHVRSIREGVITATARAIHIGGSTHLWEIRVTDSDDRLIAHAKLTMMVLASG